MVNLPMTSVMELRDHRMAIAASFAFPREISSSVLRDFFDSIGQKRKWRRFQVMSALPSKADIAGLQAQAENSRRSFSMDGESAWFSLSLAKE